MITLITHNKTKICLVVPLKHKRGIAITNAFQNFLKESNKNQTKHKFIKTVNLTIDQ